MEYSEKNYFISEVAIKIRPSAEYALLGALMLGPRHGYEILQFFNGRLGLIWHVGTSQLYALLKKIERRGLLNSRVQIQDNRPSKRIFAITPKGKEVFLEWLNSPAEHVRDLRIEFLTKLFFFKRLSLPGGTKLVAAQAETLKYLKRRVEHRLSVEIDAFDRLALGFKLVMIETWLAWLVNQGKAFVSDDQGNRS
jgi:DNA-binding PadR family transcriptional regulator